VEIERFADVSVLTAYNMQYEVINILLPYFESCYISVSYLQQKYYFTCMEVNGMLREIYGNWRLVISEG